MFETKDPSAFAMPSPAATQNTLSHRRAVNALAAWHPAEPPSAQKLRFKLTQGEIFLIHVVIFIIGDVRKDPTELKLGPVSLALG